MESAGPQFAKTEQPAQTRMEVMLAFASMAGQETIVVKILTIVLMLLASMEQRASMESEASAAAVHPERLVYCVTWKMRAPPTHATLTPYARQVLSTDRLHALALKAIKDQTVPRILTNASKVSFVIKMWRLSVSYLSSSHTS